MRRAAKHPPLVVHIIHSLGTGGLENGLVNIINRTPPERYRHAIVCLTESGEFAGRITAPGVEVIALHKRPGHDLGLYWRVWKTLRRLRPAIVHTRNLSTLEMQFVAALLPGVKRVHGEHGRDVFDLDGTNRKYNLLRKAARFVVQRYIAVSKDLERWLIDTVGVPAARVRQIYNGVDQARSHTAGLPARGCGGGGHGGAARGGQEPFLAAAICRPRSATASRAGCAAPRHHRR